jgi:hypothetical protein
MYGAKSIKIGSSIPYPFLCNHRNALETSFGLKPELDVTYAQRDHFTPISPLDQSPALGDVLHKASQTHAKKKKETSVFASVSGACLLKAAGGGVRMNI